MKYLAVQFRSSDIKDWQKDLLIDALADLDFDSFEDNESGFTAYIPESRFDVQLLESLLLTQVAGFHLDYTTESLADTNWNIEWESNFQPISIDELCHVRATFHPNRPEFP